MSDDQFDTNLSRSICEEAINEFTRSDDSLAQLVADAHLDVRDFMTLSLVCDQSTLSIDQLVRALGLSRESVLDCVDRLEHVGLLSRNAGITHHDGHEISGAGLDVSATAQGRKLTRRILSPG